MERTQKAPAVAYRAIGHGRELTLGALGVPTLLVFVGRETSGQAKPLTQAVRDVYPDASQLVIANVADVRGIPRLVRKPVEMLMKSSYRDAVEGLEPGRSPEDYVLILPDWDGEAYAACAVDDVSKRVAVAVLERDGTIAGTYQGDDPLTFVLATLRETGVIPVA
jgi:hypothetical protein